jgi:hypothetical protein
VTATWRIDPKLSLEAGIRVEASTISQKGDTRSSESFLFPIVAVEADQAGLDTGAGVAWKPSNGPRWGTRLARSRSNTDQTVSTRSSGCGWTRTSEAAAAKVMVAIRPDA